MSVLSISTHYGYISKYGDLLTRLFWTTCACSVWMTSFLTVFDCINLWLLIWMTEKCSSHQRITFRSSFQSDKCFVLLKQIKISTNKKKCKDNRMQYCSVTCTYNLFNDTLYNRAVYKKLYIPNLSKMMFCYGNNLQIIISLPEL